MIFYNNTSFTSTSESNTLVTICNEFTIDIENTIAIRDGENDICMVRKAGIGIALQIKHYI